MSVRNYTHSKTTRIENITVIQALIDSKLSRRAQLEFFNFFSLSIKDTNQKIPRNIYLNDWVKLSLPWILFYHSNRFYERFRFDKNLLSELTRFNNQIFPRFGEKLFSLTYNKRLEISNSFVNLIATLSTQEKELYKYITIRCDGTHTLTTFEDNIYAKSDWKSFKNKFRASFNTLVFQLMNGLWIGASDSKPNSLYPDTRLLEIFFPKVAVMITEQDKILADRLFPAHSNFIIGHRKPRNGW